MPAIIGMCVTALICVFGPLTQAGMNPARDLAPRIVAVIAGWPAGECFRGFYVYICGPAIGGVFGAWAQTRLISPGLKRVEECGCEGTADCNDL